MLLLDQSWSMRMLSGTTVSNTKKIELEKIQTEAARIATATTKLISLSNLYKEIYWDTLQQGWLNYLSSLLPQQVNKVSKYNLRSSNDLQTIRTNTTLYNNSFLPSTLREWNTCPQRSDLFLPLIPLNIIWAKANVMYRNIIITEHWMQFIKFRSVFEKLYWFVTLSLR